MLATPLAIQIGIFDTFRTKVSFALNALANGRRWRRVVDPATGHRSRINSLSLQFALFTVGAEWMVAADICILSVAANLEVAALSAVFVET